MVLVVYVLVRGPVAHARTTIRSTRTRTDNETRGQWTRVRYLYLYVLTVRGDGEAWVGLRAVGVFVQRALPTKDVDRVVVRGGGEAELALGDVGHDEPA